jgi:hypothetical protein
VELDQAIEEFRPNRWAELCEDPKRAKGKCGLVSYEFVRHLDACDIESLSVEMIGAVGKTAPPFPMFNPGDLIVHTVVLVDGKYVDWSARQFDPTADHPSIIEPWGLFQAHPEDMAQTRAALRAVGYRRRIFPRSYEDVVN